MNRVEEGVSNFREFQSDARAFFTRHETREEERNIHQSKRDQEIKDALEAKNKRMGIVLGVIAVIPVVIKVLEIAHVLPKP
jgi:hypothetical protein